MNQPSGQVDVALVGFVAFFLYIAVAAAIALVVIKVHRAVGRSKRSDADRESSEGSSLDSQTKIVDTPPVETTSRQKVNTQTRQEYLSYMQNRYSKGKASRVSIDGMSRRHSAAEYHYAKKRYIMTQSERDFYRRIFSIFGREYLIFPQVHLSTLFWHEKWGQNWKGALAKIQRKSVDYVLCDTELRPVCAIELDDVSHERLDRVERDDFVNSIFHSAGMPLARFSTQVTLEDSEVRRLVEIAVSSYR